MPSSGMLAYTLVEHCMHNDKSLSRVEGRGAYWTIYPEFRQGTVVLDPGRTAQCFSGKQAHIPWRTLTCMRTVLGPTPRAEEAKGWD